MADDTTWTSADLASLESAIASGAMRVKYQDREIEYRSISEMSQARRMIRQKLGLATEGKGGGLFGGTRITATSGKGLDY